MRNGGDTTPYQTDYEVGLDMPGLSTNVVISHDKLEHDKEAFLNGLGGFARLDTKYSHEPHIQLEGRFTAEQLLGVFLMMSAEEV